MFIGDEYAVVSADNRRPRPAELNLPGITQARAVPGLAGRANIVAA